MNQISFDGENINSGNLIKGQKITEIEINNFKNWVSQKFPYIMASLMVPLGIFGIYAVQLTVMSAHKMAWSETF